MVYLKIIHLKHQLWTVIAGLLSVLILAHLPILTYKNSAFLEIFQLKSVLNHPKFVHC